eukprot:1323638-Amorphochlora_amoeboformis.AAC.1
MAFINHNHKIHAYGEYPHRSLKPMGAVSIPQSRSNPSDFVSAFNFPHSGKPLHDGGTPGSPRRISIRE